MAEWGPSVLVWAVILALIGAYIVLRVKAERKDREHMEYMRDLQARVDVADKAMWEWVERTDKCPMCSGCGRVERRQQGEQEGE